MRNTIFTTILIAVLAVGMAFGVFNADKIKTFFSNAPETATALVADADTSATGESAEIATAEADQASSVQEGAMTPIDLSQTPLNDTAPAAGDEQAASEDARNATPPPAVDVKEDISAQATELEEKVKNVPPLDIKRALEDRAIGSSKAPLTVYDYSSLTCPHCATFHNDILPQIKKNYIDTGKVRWVFKTFPLNEPALRGEMIARCVPPEKYVEMVDMLFANQQRWAFEAEAIPTLNMLVKVAGVTDEQFLACVNNKELEAGILKIAQEGTDKYNISSTPTFIINDGAKKISGAGTYDGFAYDLDRLLKEMGVGNTAPEATTEAKPAL